MSQFRSHYYTVSPMARSSGKLRRIGCYLLAVLALALVLA